MIATFDFVGGSDLPGELHEPEVWEETVDEDCSLCFRPGAEASGLCQHCADHLPRAGGCGIAAAIVTAIAGGGNLDTPLAHLIGCGDCRMFFGTLAGMERAADMETRHAAELATAAA